jgi:hypothetical protein
METSRKLDVSRSDVATESLFSAATAEALKRISKVGSRMSAKDVVGGNQALYAAAAKQPPGEIGLQSSHN